MHNAQFRKTASKEDLAKALLVTVTNNIGSIALSAAVREVNNVVFLICLYLHTDTSLDFIRFKDLIYCELLFIFLGS